MEQNYRNHIRLTLGYHKLLVPLLLVGLIGAAINLSNNLHTDGLYAASLLVFLFVCLIWTAFYARSFALKAQDRAIRAEENLRYFALTGKLLPAGLKLSQIIALRFAPDDEFPSLVSKAIPENLSSKQIKKEIKTWKADHHRV